MTPDEADKIMAQPHVLAANDQAIAELDHLMDHAIGPAYVARLEGDRDKALHFALVGAALIDPMKDYRELQRLLMAALVRIAERTKQGADLEQEIIRLKAAASA